MKTLEKRTNEFLNGLNKLRKIAAVLYPEEIRTVGTFTSKLGGK